MCVIRFLCFCFACLLARAQHIYQCITTPRQRETIEMECYICLCCFVLCNRGHRSNALVVSPEYSNDKQLKMNEIKRNEAKQNEIECSAVSQLCDVLYWAHSIQNASHVITTVKRHLNAVCGSVVLVVLYSCSISDASASIYRHSDARVSWHIWNAMKTCNRQC